MTEFTGESSAMTVDEIMQLLFDEMGTENVSKVFPNGYENLKERICKIAGILFLDSSLISLEDYRESNLLYIQSWLRKSGGLDGAYLDNSVVKARIVRRFSSFVENRVSDAVDYCISCIYADYPEYLERDRCAGMDNWDAYESDEEFGIKPEKPVHIAGFGADQAYLSRLRTQSNGNLLIVRAGSMQIASIKGPVDRYIISREDRIQYCDIYLWNYAIRTSRKAPNGLSADFLPHEVLEGKKPMLPKGHVESLLPNNPTSTEYPDGLTKKEFLRTRKNNCLLCVVASTLGYVTAAFKLLLFLPELRLVELIDALAIISIAIVLVLSLIVQLKQSRSAAVLLVIIGFLDFNLFVIAAGIIACIGTFSGVKIPPIECDRS